MTSKIMKMIKIERRRKITTDLCVVLEALILLAG